MIRCQMNSFDFSDSQSIGFQAQQQPPTTTLTPPLFLQAPNDLSTLQMTCSPMQPPDRYPTMASDQQSTLCRSKSLNDISIDSQISAFASDRFINIHMNNNNPPTTDNSILASNCNNNNNNNNYNSISYYDDNPIAQTFAPNNQLGGTNLVNDRFACLPNSYDVYNQTNCNQILPEQNGNYATPLPNINNYSQQYGNSQQFGSDLVTRDLNNHQCSRPIATTSTATNNTSVFNLCNPLVMNLNGVTEQIGNLQL